ncbi:unnamed protein product [Brachionus calyciflorus]|uniref:Origin recognition complex subunit 5 n=1 Tax=Brachionus calyciflorus TaxID=104777 RepID=A0A813M674_9BILA|nr:unnamed protein product [Brachionus calyciflorus]
MEDLKLQEVYEEVLYREKQLDILFDLLIKNDNFIYPILHLFGLSGTGKTYTIRKFMKKFCENPQSGKKIDDKKRLHVYLNCNELCYGTTSLLFSEILKQISNALPANNEKDLDDIEIEMEIEKEKPVDLSLNDNFDQEEEDEDLSDIKMNDFSAFLRQLKRKLERAAKKTTLYLIFDNAENLKYFSDSSNLLLTLCKLNEYINLGDWNSKINISSIFLSEIDWHSLISDCELMSRTESARPFIIYFDEYTKEQMNVILKQSAISLISIQDYHKSSKRNNYHDIEFYTKIILDVFFPICKDLNEIQYLIQIYYEQLINSVEKSDRTERDSYEKMMSAWNKMKPFLKQALTQIYLRQSMFTSTSKPDKLSPFRDESLTLEFESLNILNEKNENYLSESKEESPMGCNQLPKLMKYLLISSYIATHNPAKYDKKLLDYNTSGKSRKSKFTAQKFQQNEENQRSAALKTQAFDSNRLMAIFLAICTESGYSQMINLSQIQLNLKTLKSLHYLHQTNSSYSCLDEPKFKCLIDFETILNLANSLKFNIKQYLVEYITI